MADVNVQQNAPTPAPNGDRGMGWLWALLLVIVLAIAIWFVVGRDGGDVVDEASDIEIDVPEQIDVNVDAGGDEGDGGQQQQPQP